MRTVHKLLLKVGALFLPLRVKTLALKVVDLAFCRRV